MDKEIITLLVDDEDGCLDILQYYLQIHCPRLKIAATANTPEQAVGLLNTLPIDLAFLDIHLFDSNIFQLLPRLNNPNIEKVFVTAYDEYALKAFSISALDYLLKPLDTKEIIRCYEKIARHFDGANSFGKNDIKPEKITLRQGNNLYIIHTEDILLLKAKGIYTDIYFEHDKKIKNILVCKPINLVHKQWSLPDLIQVHRSYVINLKWVRGIRKTGINLSLEMHGNHIVPVAKRRANEFLERFQ